MTEIDLAQLRAAATHKDRYPQQLKRLAALKKQTSCIEAAVAKASENIKAGTRSFIIYGEPQSGKTEMMICLTAKLVDSGSHIIIHLLNDSVQLLQQNLDRFQRSSLSPAAKNFSDVLDPDISLKTGDHIIFCKKNASDLAKLINKTRNIHGKVIVDDEADFATPNALINKGEVTRINHLIGELIGSDGIYIGVTATPARLDLNNTFDNDNEQWVNFPPHRAIVASYVDDMRSAIREVYRVLVPGGSAVYVIGENTVAGTYIRNARILISLARRSGLHLKSETRRVLPPNRRYMPPPKRKRGAAFDTRMRTEVILRFRKPKHRVA